MDPWSVNINTFGSKHVKITSELRLRNQSSGVGWPDDEDVFVAWDGTYGGRASGEVKVTEMYQFCGDC
jgi:hypothetical protein